MRRLRTRLDILSGLPSVIAESNYQSRACQAYRKQSSAGARAGFQVAGNGPASC